MQVSPDVQELATHAPPSLVGVPAPHTPFAQVVPAVQALPSSQAAPSFPGTLLHVFEASSHWKTKHPLAGPQVLGSPPQKPALQRSLTVQNRKSSHVAPSLPGPGWQTPCVHTPCVQGLKSPSSHSIPSLAGCAWQTAPMHTPTAHGLLFGGEHEAPSFLAIFWH